ncbi:MAG: alpha/beta fold hydrolase, partial [Candidatus Nitrosomaritimum yanchengensis]
MKIVLLHGWGHNKKIWGNIVSKLGKNVISLDMPGFGDEPLVKDDWGVLEYANWVENKIKNYKNVILIGHSFGGRVSAEIASKRPNYLKALILSGSPNIYRPTLTTKLKIYIYKIFKFFIPQNLRKAFYSNDLKESGKLEKIFRKVVTYDQTKQLKKINIPTLLIWGEKDDEAPLRLAYEINELIKDSELKIIENAGHNTF